MQPILFRIPVTAEGIPVYGFGFMLFLTFLATTWLASRRAQKVGIPGELIQDIALWIFIGGLLGARITYLIFHEQKTDPLEILKELPYFWEGGIILYGAVGGAILAYIIGHHFFFRYKPRVTIWRMADVIAPTVALGLILGRLGCLLNGCCYGQVACPDCPSMTFPLSAPPMEKLVRTGHQTAFGFLVTGVPDKKGALVTQVEANSPAAVVGELQPGDLIVRLNDEPVNTPTHLDKWLANGDIPRDQKTEVRLVVEREGKEITLPPFAPCTLGLQPTQIYESISMGLLLLVLFAFEPFKRREGQVMAVMMVGYGVHRFLNEILRSDERPVGLERYVSVLLVVAGTAVFVWFWIRPGTDEAVNLSQPVEKATNVTS